MAACSAVTARQVLPNCNASMYIYTYSKAGATDYLTMNASVTNPVLNIRFASASDDSANADDPLTYSGTRAILSTNTGAGRILLIGNC